MKRTHRLTSLLLAACTGLTAPAFSQRQMEKLDRGVVAIHQPDGKVFVSWRLLATDPEDVAFNVYRTTTARASERAEYGGFSSRNDPGGGTVKVNREPVTGGTWVEDAQAVLSRTTEYTVRPVVDGKESGPGAAFTLPAGAPPLPYHSIPLQTPPGYIPGDSSVGDLDGGGRYEIVVHQTGMGKDNSQPGMTDAPIFQAYKLDGTLLWTINLGRNIREGAHYTQFLVYDFDGDGRAEFVCKTAEGTTVGEGKGLGGASAPVRCGPWAACSCDRIAAARP